jgi:transcriptional regulator
LRQQGAEIRSGGKLSAEDLVDVRRLRAEGWSHQKIADRFGVTRSAISIRLKAEAADGSVCVVPDHDNLLRSPSSVAIPAGPVDGALM